MKCVFAFASGGNQAAEGMINRLPIQVGERAVGENFSHLAAASHPKLQPAINNLPDANT
jgi:hypothetical protein